MANFVKIHSKGESKPTSSFFNLECDLIKAVELRRSLNRKENKIILHHLL